MLTFEGGLNLRKIEADLFVTVTSHQKIDNLSNTVILKKYQNLMFLCPAKAELFMSYLGSFKMVFVTHL